MTDKNERSLFDKIVARLVMIVPLLFSVTVKMKGLIESEAALAKRNIILLVSLCLILTMLLTTTWACLLGLAFIYLSHHLSLSVSILLIALFNFLLLVIVALLIKGNLTTCLLFPETRRIIKELLK